MHGAENGARSMTHELKTGGDRGYLRIATEEAFATREQRGTEGGTAFAQIVGGAFGIVAIDPAHRRARGNLDALGEPAVAHLIERPFAWLGLPDEVLGPVADVTAMMRQAAALEIETDLRRALRESEGELFVVYQPVVDLQRGGPCGVEALVRWRHPQRGLISPLEFIPVAEESGLVVAVGADIGDRQEGDPPLLDVPVVEGAGHFQRVVNLVDRLAVDVEGGGSHRVHPPRCSVDRGAPASCRPVTRRADDNSASRSISGWNCAAVLRCA